MPAPWQGCPQHDNGQQRAEHRLQVVELPGPRRADQLHPAVKNGVARKDANTTA